MAAYLVEQLRDAHAERRAVIQNIAQMEQRVSELRMRQVELEGLVRKYIEDLDHWASKDVRAPDSRQPEQSFDARAQRSPALRFLERRARRILRPRQIDRSRVTLIAAEAIMVELDKTSSRALADKIDTTLTRRLLEIERDAARRQVDLLTKRLEEAYDVPFYENPVFVASAAVVATVTAVAVTAYGLHAVQSI